MNLYLDNQLIRKFASIEDQAKNTALLNACLKAKNVSLEQVQVQIQFVLEWPSLLEYLGFGSILENDPKIDAQNKMLSSLIEILKLDSEQEVLFYLYDQIFVECLTQIKKLPEVHPRILIDQIQRKQAKPLFSGILDPFELALNCYEKKLTEAPHEAIHDLTLNLAWDRVCIFLGTIFDETTLKTENGLKILKDCLIESYRHLKLEGKTSPSFIRLAEALFAFYMKEENLDTHNDEEWEVLCKSVETLQSRESLSNVSYIDSGVAIMGQMEKKLSVLTLEPDHQVKARLALANQMMTKLKREDPNWCFYLHPYEIFNVKTYS